MNTTHDLERLLWQVIPQVCSTKLNSHSGEAMGMNRVSWGHPVHSPASKQTA